MVVFWHSGVRRMWTRHWFLILCGLILIVSLYDTFLIVKFHVSIKNMEENPIGRWLIQTANGNVEPFVRAKLAGTLIVMTVLYQIHRYSERLSKPVTASLATFQSGLLAYLTLV